ncbi:CHY zinc finger protein [Pseudoloma neurophilia]|uniref:CHY zinc finger protein n=1 Tax=Pseudoloma neurophilia TaxID=146866 RepID=A0A0R0M1X0_9MICR|nr:CHY zinc finger protein [Pseudoloma neurophilia]
MPVLIQPPRNLQPGQSDVLLFYKSNITNSFYQQPVSLQIVLKCSRCEKDYQKIVYNEMYAQIIQQENVQKYLLSKFEEQSQEKDALQKFNSEKKEFSNDLNFKCKCSNQLFIHFEKDLNIKNVNILTIMVHSFIFNCECGVFYFEMCEKTTFDCFKCFSRISVIYKDVIFKNKEKNITFKIKDLRKNEPLPQNGTCKHYSKSFRWFLFPCCNKFYPCDDCHNENEQHPMILANRTVCGWCSNWQPCLCSKDSKKGNKSHWNGGKGTRDKTTMSKKDKQKYKK